MTLPTFPRARRALRAARAATTDVVFVIGLVAIAAGCALVSPPLGLIVGGLEAVLCAVRFEGGKQ